MHVDGAGGLALAGARRRVAQAADVVLGDLVRVRDEVAAALASSGHRQHAVVDELDQPPGARDRQQRLEVLRLGLLLVELVGLDDGVDLVELGHLVQVLVDVQEQEAWMFGCQVMNQSVENGSWPLLGDLPATSLYRRSSRS